MDMMESSRKSWKPMVTEFDNGTITLQPSIGYTMQYVAQRLLLIGILDRNLIQVAGERILTNPKITKRKTKWCQGLRIELYRRWQRCVDVRLLSQGGTDLLHINDNRMVIGNDYWFLYRRCGVRNNIQRDASLRLEVWVLLERLETAETILLQSYFVILPRNF
jgi:hypothetical protein